MTTISGMLVTTSLSSVMGYAGAVTALEAADAGSSVLLIEKMQDPGGISICSGGNVRAADSAVDALAYLKETSAGTTPDDVLEALAVGMTELAPYFEKISKTCNATVASRPLAGNLSSNRWGHVFLRQHRHYP